MMATVEVSGDLIAPEFWDTFFFDAFLLMLGVAVFVIGPSLVWWLLRPSTVVLRGVLGDERPPQDADAVDRIARTLKASQRAPVSHGERSESPSAPQAGGSPPEQPQASSDRRRHLRREGRPTRIGISNGTGEPVPGWVLNRSRGGLGIALDRPLAVGTQVEVRPFTAPDDVPWVKVEVRSCRPKGKRWYIGCRFSTELPWSLILLFG
jgi:hypothetical protein